MAEINPMPQRALIDTSVLVAVINVRDSQHARATAAIRSAISANVVLVYCDVVIAEAISVLARRAEEQKRSDEFAAEIEKLFAQAPIAERTRLFTKVDVWFDEVVTLVQQTKGRLNFNDALIVVACRELGIDTLLSFDADFDAIPDLTRLK